MTRLLAGLDRLIDRERVRNYSWIVVVLAYLALVLNLTLGAYPVTRAGDIAFGDFLAHWTGARMVIEGRAGQLYEPEQQARLQHQFAPTGTFSWFVSPPVAVWLYLPFARLGYGSAALVWTAFSAGLLALSLALARPLLGLDHRRDFGVLVLVFAAGAATFELLGAGQDTALALALVLVAIRLLSRRRDVLAGAVLALGVFKPQLFVLVPIALLVQRRYRALASLAVVGVALVGSSILLNGWGRWLAWLDALRSPLYSQGVQVGQTWKMQSISSLLTTVGVAQWLAYPVLVAGAVALVWRARLVRSDPEHVWALTLLTTVVCSPHVMLYDLVLLLPVMVFFHVRLNVRAVRLLAVLTAVLLASVALRYTVSLAGPGWLTLLGAPWSALPLLALWVILLRGGPAPDQVGGTASEDLSAADTPKVPRVRRGAGHPVT